MSLGRAHVHRSFNEASRLSMAVSCVQETRRLSQAQRNVPLDGDEFERRQLWGSKVCLIPLRHVASSEQASAGKLR